MASMLMTSWNMAQVPFTMNLYLHCLTRLTTSFLLSSKDIRTFFLSKSRQVMATLMAIPTIPANHLEAELDCTICTIWLWGEIDMPHCYLTHPIICISAISRGIICFAFSILFCKGLEMIMGSDKICTASFTYIQILTLCHLYSFTSYLKSHKWELSKDTFLVQLSSHNFTPKRNELRYHCCLSQLYFIGH
jgi:hypothetical protein